MCNCGGGAYNYSFSVKGCGKKVEDLTTLRNKMVTLYNVTKDIILKEEYKDFRLEIDSMINMYYTEKTCPDITIINLLKQQVDYEYSKYYNK